MGWYDSTGAILGVKGLEQQKKNDRWSKLMDIANVLQNTAGLGADLWKTVSGRKYGTDERIASQVYADTVREDTQLHDIAMENKRLENDKAFQTFKNENPGKSMEQLTAEFYQTPAGIAYLDEQDKRYNARGEQDTLRRLREIAAQTNVSRGSPEYQKILDDKIAWIIELAKDRFGMKDELGNKIWNPTVVDRAILEKFLKDQYIDDPTWSDTDKKYFDTSLTSMLNAPGVSTGTGGGVNKGGNKTVVDLSVPLASFQELEKMLGHYSRIPDQIVPYLDELESLSNSGKIPKEIGYSAQSIENDVSKGAQFITERKYGPIIESVNALVAKALKYMAPPPASASIPMFSIPDSGWSIKTGQ